MQSPLHRHQYLFLFLPDRRVILPGNLLYFTFYIRPLELHVLGIKGADGGVLGVPQSLRDQETEGPASEPPSTDISATDLPLQFSQLELGSPSPPVTTSSPCTPEPRHNGSPNVAQSPAEGSLDLDVRAAEDWEGWLGSAVDLGAKRNTDTFYFISSTTRIHFSRGRAESHEQDLPRVTYDMIGGLGPQLAALRRLIELPLTQPELFQRLGESGLQIVLYHVSFWCCFSCSEASWRWYSHLFLCIVLLIILLLPVEPQLKSGFLKGENCPCCLLL